MAYIDRDVFEALAGTAAGRQVFDRLAAEMAPRNAQDLPDWMLGFQAFRSTLDARRFLATIANSIYTGRPTVESSSLLGRTVRDQFKRRLVAIVTKGET